MYKRFFKRFYYSFYGTSYHLASYSYYHHLVIL